MSVDLSVLNGPQRQAAEQTEGPLLVLAGAGSGKTRVLTYRIAHMVEDLGIAPWEIMAITFTNKAAAEMRERLNGLIGAHGRGMWVSTFHSMCVRILRANAQVLGFSENFTIYDDADSKRLVKDIMEELDIDPRRFQLNALRNRISTAKNELQVPNDFADAAKDPVGKQAARVYTRLQERLRQANAFDFDDLLMYTYLLFKYHPDVLEAYQDRVHYLLVDEYQDTNHAQYELCRLLASKHGNIMVVGDDDQSIYSWRGADIRNILEFERDYPNCVTVRLEQNYRSAGNILNAANAVIANNQRRKSKRLFTDAPDGAKIQVYTAADERDEGRWIAGQIEKRHGEGLSYNQIAVFYRTNAQSRMLEDMMLRAGVPYRIVGGTRFFERAEISDVMAYLTLIVNPADDMAAKRVINVPRRGIGKTTIEYLDKTARESGISFMSATELAVVDEALRSATRKAIAQFVSIIKNARTYEGDLRRVVETIIDESGLVAALEAEGTDEARGRVENIKEFLSVVDEFSDTHQEEDAMFEAPTVVSREAVGDSDEAFAFVADQGFDAASDFDNASGSDALQDVAPGDQIDLFAQAGLEIEEEPEVAVRVLRGDSLADFVEWVRLRTDLDSVSEDGKAVTLMTVHSSKGLEFDCVFVAGMEETLFPHMNSIGDAESVEEERRLAYVAITRARKYLHLTCASRRQLFGQTQVNPQSRFVLEIPDELRVTSGVGSAGFSGTGWEKRGSRRGIAGSGSEAGEGRVFGRSSATGSGERARHGRSSFSTDAAQKKSGAAQTFAVGDTVNHKTFGRGTVTKVDGDTLFVRFAKLGQTKKLLKDYAPIVKIS